MFWMGGSPHGLKLTPRAHQTKKIAKKCRLFGVKQIL
jgi:hypothetical protein